MTVTTNAPDTAAMCECGREMYRHGQKTVNGSWTFPCHRLAEIDEWCERGERSTWWQMVHRKRQR